MGETQITASRARGGGGVWSGWRQCLMRGYRQNGGVICTSKEMTDTRRARDDCHVIWREMCSD